MAEISAKFFLGNSRKSWVRERFLNGDWKENPYLPIWNLEPQWEPLERMSGDEC